jgi:hypothetical protein
MDRQRTVGMHPSAPQMHPNSSGYVALHPSKSAVFSPFQPHFRGGEGVTEIRAFWGAAHVG